MAPNGKDGFSATVEFILKKLAFCSLSRLDAASCARAISRASIVRWWIATTMQYNRMLLSTPKKNDKHPVNH
jgi:hypothetical protein